MPNTDENPQGNNAQHHPGSQAIYGSIASGTDLKDQQQPQIVLASNQ
jgi:hypothetical protein